MKRYMLMAAIIFLSCPWSRADIYSWEDDGAVHFTDNPQTIPAKKKNRIAVRPGDTQSRDWQYLNTEHSVNHYYDPATVVYLGKDCYSVLIKEEYRRESYEKRVELDCTRKMFRYGSSPNKSDSVDEEEDSFRYDAFEPLTNSMRALSRIVCN